MINKKIIYVYDKTNYNKRFRNYYKSNYKKYDDDDFVFPQRSYYRKTLYDISFKEYDFSEIKIKKSIKKNSKKKSSFKNVYYKI